MAFIAPVVGASVSSGWGEPREYRDGTHYGIDIRGAIGTPVLAIGDGVVFRADKTDDSPAGKWVGIDHPGGLVSRYLHLNSVLVNKGQQVSKGQQIGTLGRTGIKRSKEHLHFDMAVRSREQYPYPIPTQLPKVGWGWAIPSEIYIPAKYDPDVAKRAKEWGFPKAYVAVGLGGLALIAIGGYVAYQLWKR